MWTKRSDSSKSNFKIDYSSFSSTCQSHLATTELRQTDISIPLFCSFLRNNSLTPRNLSQNRSGLLMAYASGDVLLERNSIHWDRKFAAKSRWSESHIKNGFGRSSRTRQINDCPIYLSSSSDAVTQGRSAVTVDTTSSCLRPSSNSV